MFAHLSKNLNHLMQYHNSSVIKLSQATGIPASTIKKLRNGENINPTLTTLIPITEHFNISLDKLISELCVIEDHTLPLVHHKTFPIVSWEDAHRYQDAVIKEKIASPLRCSDDSFALRLNHHSYKSFKQNSLIFIDPKTLPENNDVVLAIHPNARFSELKVFYQEDGINYLYSKINPHHYHNAENYQIIGVVIGSWQPLKKQNLESTCI